MWESTPPVSLVLVLRLILAAENREHTQIVLLMGLVVTMVKDEREVAQSCPTLCDPMDCSLPESSVHGILQARIQEWVAISYLKCYD